MEKMITEEEKKLALQSAVFYLGAQQPFYGSLIQELTIRYADFVPAAGITFNSKLEQYEIYLNPVFFCSLSTDERVAVLHHEILHFTNKHLFRLPFIDAKPEDHKIYNMAGDMAINQYIKNLPDGCIDVKNYQCKDPSNPSKVIPFPTFKNMEEYYELIRDNQEENKEQMQMYKDFDQHAWTMDAEGNITDDKGQSIEMTEEMKQKMLDAAKKAIKRTIEKTSYSHSSVPESIRDLLDQIDQMAAGINYKQLLKRAIKKTVSMTDRESNWKRPNKRYGVFSPGTKLGALPKLAFWIDTSGSISTKELNEFLSIMAKFLQNGVRNCVLNLWHTDVYYTKKYKLREIISPEVVEAGGTDINPAMTLIKKTSPDLSIILTDGYYDISTVQPKAQMIFIISKGGNKDHPLKHLGKTIPLDALKD